MTTIKEKKMRRLTGLLAAAIASLALAGPAYANVGDGFGIASFDATATNQDGSAFTQAGGHPFEATTTIDFNVLPAPPNLPDGDVKDFHVDLPAGFIGNPTAVPTCSESDLEARGASGSGFIECPSASQVGIVTLGLPNFFAGFHLSVPVYNMDPPAIVPAQFAFNALGSVVHLVPSVRTGGDYGLSIDIPDTAQLALAGSELTLWGVPFDHAHDALRATPGQPFSCVGFDEGGPSGPNTFCSGGGASVSSSPTPFLTNPTDCSAGPLTTTLRVNSWQHPGDFKQASVLSHDSATPPNPTGVTGCDKLPFDASLSGRPTTSQAGAPAGLSVDVKIPQRNNAAGLEEAHLKTAVVTLPGGMAISPSAADGLQACSDEQIALKSTDDPTCPDASRIGTVSIDTPLLKKPMDGTVYLGTQQSDDPASGKMFRLFLVAKGPGVMVKLPGSVVPDEKTGQLTTTFDNNPQLPFDALHLELRGGPHAPLTNPTTCGTKTTVAKLTSWSGKTVESKSSFEVTGCGDANRFAPTFEAGTTNPLAGAFSPFTMTIRRADADQVLSGISVNLPSGLLGALRNVPFGSQVGTVTVSAGPGSNPFSLGGQVYLEGPYKGAPFSLKVVVPAKAGPFDLGEVVVRSPLNVDAANAKVSAPSDPLPTILKGVPLQVRMVNITLDRPEFMFNATSCAPQTVSATLASITGRQSQVSSRYQPTGCGELPLDPKLKLAFVGKGQTKDGTHPGVEADLTQQPGESGLKRVQVALPLSVALDPNNAQALCTPQQAAARACPPGSIIGNATAVTPALHQPLSGPVYFVEKVRTSKSGQQVRTLPRLWLKLEGEGVPLDLWADSSVDSTERLVTTFSSVPDAPITSFHMTIDSGKHGVLAANSDVCARSKLTNVSFDGQSGTTVDRTISVAVPACGLAIAKTTTTNSAVTVRVSGLRAGKLSLAGSGVGRASRSIRSADVASLTARLTKSARRALSRHGKVRVRLAVAFTPKGAKKAKTVTKTVTVKHKKSVPKPTAFG
jgi:hypothetical protein